MTPLIFFFFLIFFSEANYLQSPTNQASKLVQFRLSQEHQRPNTVPESESIRLADNDILLARIRESVSSANKEDHFLTNGLPGQPPSTLGLRQFAGNLVVDIKSGRSLFYYHVESQSDSASKPLVLWLNGGPGCSSLGMGAFTEIGPFGVNPDGQTLYARKFAWNEVANIIFLESPASVGFSYSNTTSDYDVIGDKRTAEDALVFLLTWFAKYPQYQGRDFYLAGESYAGYYIPELADVILNYSRDSYSAKPIINLKGFMIGNGLIEDVNDTIGFIDFAWNHALISREIRKEFLNSCSNGGFYASPACQVAYIDTLESLGYINSFNIYGPPCDPLSILNVSSGGGSFIDPCDTLYVYNYLNIPKVQEALNANRTRLPYPWSPCTTDTHHWHDTPLNMLPFYRRLIKHGLRMLLYSGDVDSIVPFIGTCYGLEAFRLKTVKPWSPWSLHPKKPVTGYHVVYNGLTYATVRGAGHEVSRSHADVLYAMFIKFLNNESL